MREAIIEEVSCYGDLTDDSNFEVLCEDEEEDFVWITREPSQQKNWNDIVHFLLGKGLKVIEINAL